MIGNCTVVSVPLSRLMSARPVVSLRGSAPGWDLAAQHRGGVLIDAETEDDRGLAVGAHRGRHLLLRWVLGGDEDFQTGTAAFAGEGCEIGDELRMRLVGLALAVGGGLGGVGATSLR